MVTGRSVASCTAIVMVSDVSPVEPFKHFGYGPVWPLIFKYIHVPLQNHYKSLRKLIGKPRNSSWGLLRTPGDPTGDHP
jgi:hypothetical protein